MRVLILDKDIQIYYIHQKLLIKTTTDDWGVEYLNPFKINSVMMMMIRNLKHVVILLHTLNQHPKILP